MSAAASPTLSLRLLGGASIEGPDGPLVGRGTRGAALAILAVVAAARGRPVSRDKLLALLWPEAPTERARPLLSDSLYKLRGAIGDDAVVAFNDDLRLNGERLSSDVEEFERLLDAGDEERAVALYAGPFLDGFHLTDATEFERWIDGERQRLAARQAAALDALASACEQRSDWPGAVVWLKRLAAHDPLAGRTAARLMLALEALGNRAAALQHARVHATLLRQELDAEPDAEVLALVERLKSEPVTPVASPSPSRHRQTSASSQPVSQSASPARVPTLDPRLTGVAVEELPRANDERVASKRETRKVPGRSSLLTGAAILAIVVLALLWSDRLRTAVGMDSRLVAQPAAGTAHSSIAVLPFDDLGPSADGGYFSDGLAEEIIGKLSMVDGLRVAARSSSFALRGAKLDARTIGDTLGVTTLLEGSVRREGNRVRVSARLVDARDGFQLWSRAYDRGVHEVIALQDAIAAAIVGALTPQLASPAASHERSAPNAETYDLYLRGIHARNQLTGESLRRAVDYFDRAIRLDSAYAPAYAGKATTLLPMVWFGHLPKAQALPQARHAAQRAALLDESLFEAHVALGMLALYFDWDWPTAERELRLAVALNPNDAHAHHFLANYLRAMGRFDEAIASRSRAFDLDRLSVRTEMLLASDYYTAGNDTLAAEHYRRAMEINPHSPLVLGQGPVDHSIGHVYERQGSFDAAIAEYLKSDSLSGAGAADLAARRRAYALAGLRGYWRARVEQLQQGGTADPVQLAWMWTRVGDEERAVQALQRAYRERSMSLVFLAVQPDFAGVRADPRVAAILEAMRLRPVS